MNSEIENAIANGEIKVFYQPKVEAGSTRVVGAEALVRWFREDRTWVYPDDFIPKLEESGEIVYVDFFVYKEVFKNIRMRIDQGKPVVPVSLNVSRVHLKDNNLYDYICDLLDKYNTPVEYIEFELTESVYIEDVEEALSLVEKLRNIGFSVSMDDFGSGYSSLNLLTNLQIDTLKIDKVFLKNDILNENEKIILKCIIEMAKKLKLNVLCEGIETVNQSRFLSSIGCDVFQGFLYSKPVPEEDFYDYLSKHMDTEINEVHFKFENNLMDTTGNYEGKFVGTRTTFTEGPAEGIKALRFVGGEPFNDCVQLPAHILHNNSFTISMWIKEEEARLWSSAFYAGFSNGFCNIMPKGWDMKTVFRVKDVEDPVGWYDVGNKVVGMNKWKMLTACYDGKNHTTSIFIDGQRCGVLENVIELTDPKMIYLGVDIYTRGFTGCVADLRIFDQTLAFHTIKKMYEDMKKLGIRQDRESEEKFEPLTEYRFSFDGTMKEANFDLQAVYTGEKIEYTQGPAKGIRAIRLPGGAIGENVIQIPGNVMDTESFSISYWIKDENPREWISTLYLENENGYMCEMPYVEENNSILRFKDLRRSEEWFDTIRKNITRKNIWNQIIIVYNAQINIMAHYVDGKYNGIKDSCPFIGKFQKMILGGDIFQDSFEGCIADLRVYNKALSITEIMELTVI